MKIEADYLVLGSGIAGLFFALKAAQHGSVAVVTKRERRESNTQYAQGGIAAAMDAADSVTSHAQDTLAAGAGLCDHVVVEGVVAEGPEVVAELLAIGAQFNEARPGVLALGREGGHAHARVVHADDIAILNELRALFDFSMLSCVWYGTPFLGAYLCLRILLLRRLSPAIPMHGN